MGAALSQTLAYLMANPHPEELGFAMITSRDSVFVKLTPSPPGAYHVSRGFAAMTSDQELYGVLRILKRISQVVGRP